MKSGLTNIIESMVSIMVLLCVSILGPSSAFCDEQGELGALIKTYEQELSEGKSSHSLLHNLAVARLKEGSFAESTACWLALWQQGYNPSAVRDGLWHSLSKAGLTLQSLSLEKHGVVVWWLSTVTDLGLRYAAMILAVIYLAISIIFGFLQVRQSQNDLVTRPMFKILAILSGVIVVGWGACFLLLNLRGHWGAVTSERPITLFQDEALSRPLKTDFLVPGLPVYTTSETHQKSLYVRLSSGETGYIDALTMRLMR
jgi:hypothetical protein